MFCINCFFVFFLCIVVNFKNGNDKKIIVVVGIVIDDNCFLIVFKIIIVVFCFIVIVCVCIIVVGGQVIIFDQLVLEKFIGVNIFFFCGFKNFCEVFKYFGFGFYKYKVCFFFGKFLDEGSINFYYRSFMLFLRVVSLSVFVVVEDFVVLRFKCFFFGKKKQMINDLEFIFVGELKKGKELE